MQGYDAFGQQPPCVRTRCLPSLTCAEAQKGVFAGSEDRVTLGRVVLEGAQVTTKGTLVL